MPDKTEGRLETRAEAWARRSSKRSTVDFTMMYAAHDAFDRDLARLQDAVPKHSGAGTITAEMQAIWTMFAKQLHIHHTAEDEALWPRLADAVADHTESGVLEAMELEHAGLNPMINDVNDALTAGDIATLATGIAALRQGLSEHMAHEEDTALPLVDNRLGQPGWDAFGKQIRQRVGGIAAGAQYLPWVLDGASDQVRTNILAILPLPARVLYRRVWEPKYRTAAHL